MYHIESDRDAIQQILIKALFSVDLIQMYAKKTDANYANQVVSCVIRIN